MRLTKVDKESFIRAVMDDVPQTDYDEQAQALFEAWLAPKLPPKLRAVYEDDSLRGCLDSNYIHDHENFPLVSGYQKAGSFATGLSDPVLKTQLTELQQLNNEQFAARQELKEQVSAVINGCSTLKSAVERLPEFVKYLPADRDGTNTAGVPVIANVVASLVKAGWPKGQAQGA